MSQSQFGGDSRAVPAGSEFFPGATHRARDGQSDRDQAEKSQTTVTMKLGRDEDETANEYLSQIARHKLEPKSPKAREPIK